MAPAAALRKFLASGRFSLARDIQNFLRAERDYRIVSRAAFLCRPMSRFRME